MTNDTSSLIRLRDSDSTVMKADDIRGFAVLGRDGQDLGTVRSLLLDPVAQEIVCFEIAWGGFLGLGCTTGVLPLGVIEEVTTTTVVVNQTQDDLEEATRAYNPGVIDRPGKTGSTYVSAPRQH